jgi:tRNA modification GTPase
MSAKNHKCIAALVTAKGSSAISSIQLAGAGAEDIFKKIFRPMSGKSPVFSVGSILYGNIFDGSVLIDEVVIGCEAKDCFSINCHGNPIIVENILELLKRHDVRITEAREVMAYMGEQKYGDNTIAIEAEIGQTQAATIYGAKIIRHQTKMGLLQAANWWLENLDTLEIDDIRDGAEQILNDSRIADLFIRDVKIVIAGPPNTGKSTLFNRLCGREKAIVTDIAGTTRDWLSAKIRLKKVMAEFFDTAGLDQILSGQNTIDAESQGQAVELIKNCDLVLFVVDFTNPAIVMAGLTESLKKLVIFNKCDLAKKLPAEGLSISAKTGQGIDKLITAIEKALGVADFDVRKTVCFTDRQKGILKQAAGAGTKQQIKELITELLKGSVAV